MRVQTRDLYRYVIDHNRTSKWILRHLQTRQGNGDFRVTGWGKGLGWTAGGLASMPRDFNSFGYYVTVEMP